MSLPAIEPVTDANLAEFSGFLYENLSRERTAAQWEDSLRVNWGGGRPNYGFLMRAGGPIVGGIGAIYACRKFGDRDEHFCNITSWCVLDAFRKQSMRLAMAVVGQAGYHFTDFSPTPVVGGVLRFLKFKPIDERQTVILNLPRPLARGTIVSAPDDIAATLTGQSLRIYRDHSMFPWLKHLAVGDGERWCHMVYKRRMFKGWPSAHVLHVGDPVLLSDTLGAVCSHMLSKGMLSTHIETRHMLRKTWPTRIRSGFNAKLYLSKTLDASQIDYLYSESVAMDL